MSRSGDPREPTPLVRGRRVHLRQHRASRRVGRPGRGACLTPDMHATPSPPAATPDPPAPVERPPMPPDTVPTGVPPERPFSPSSPDVWPGTPAESPVPGLPPEVGPAIAPVEVPPPGTPG
jgi:hypothetical protein